MTQTAKKCPNCGVVDNYEAGPLTVCTNCGEVLAESWALGDAVTDIVDGASWLSEFRSNNAAPPIAPAIADDDGVPGLIGPGGSIDSLLNELRAAAPALPPFPPPVETPASPIFLGTVSQGSLALSQARTELQEVMPPPLPPPLPRGPAHEDLEPVFADAAAVAIAVVPAGPVPPITPPVEKPAEPIFAKARSSAVREKNASRPSGRPVSVETPSPLRSISSETPGPKLVLIPLTSPGVSSTVADLIQGTAGRVAKEAIDTKPILVVRGLDAAGARALSEQLERVGIPSKVRDVEPPHVSVVESSTRSWKRTAIAAAVALAVGVVLFLVVR